jgi:hypothetical protein
VFQYFLSARYANISYRNEKNINLNHMTDPWSNIEVASGDPEITAINELERSLGSLPSTIRQVRE